MTGRTVADFWPAVSFGLLSYRMDRTHSIMRIATTASPVSGADVRDRMRYLALKSDFGRAVHVIRNALRHASVVKFFKNKYQAVNDQEQEDERQPRPQPRPQPSSTDPQTQTLSGFRGRGAQFATSPDLLSAALTH